MGTLDPVAANIRRKIKIIDTTGYTPSQLETVYNTNYGEKGWRMIGFVTVANKLYIVAEKEFAE